MTTLYDKVFMACQAEMPDCDDDLITLYALLVLTLGDGATMVDIHDAWALWRKKDMPNHSALIPYEELAPEIQELDRPYMDAVRRVAQSGFNE